MALNVVLKSQPKDVAKGRFECAIGADGLTLRQKKKPEIRVPVGSRAEYLASFLGGGGPAPNPDDYSLPWYFKVIAAAPIGIPIMTLGGALPGAVGAGLAFGCLGIAQNEEWSVERRLAWSAEHFRPGLPGWRSAACAVLVLAVAAGCGPGTPAEGPSEPAAASVPTDLPCRRWEPQTSGTTASFRGLDAAAFHAGREVVWVSGTGGTWGRTADGGESWQMSTVPGAGELDFRDVDAFDATTAYLMSAGPGELSRIYKTADGGETWELQHTNLHPQGFFDGMAFWDAEHGVLYGDPVDGRFSVLTTADGGATWVPAESLPPALDGEAGFAASGSGVAVVAGGHAWFGTGGPAARVFRSADYGRTWTVAATPIKSGSSSAGIFSLAFHDRLHGVAVGGDYTLPEEATANAAVTADGGVTWSLIEASPPAGYRSAVAYRPGFDRALSSAGTSGSDLSLDGGDTWASLDTADYNSVSFADSPCAGWAAGPEGRIARLRP